MQTSKINSEVICISRPLPSPSKKKKELVHKENYSTVLCSAVPSCVHTAQVPHLQLMHLRILVHMESLSFALTLLHTRTHAHALHTRTLAPQHTLPGTAPRILEFPLASRFLPPLTSTPPRSVIRLNKSN